MRGLIVALLLSAVPASAHPQVRAGTPADRDQALKIAAERAAAGRTEEAIRVLRAASDRWQSVEVLLQLARIQASGRDATGALDSLRRAVALAPNSEEVLNAFAQVSLAAKRPVPA